MSYFHITILSYLYTFDEVLGHFALEPNERWSSDIVDLLGGSFIGFLIICLSRAALVLIKSKKRMKLIFFGKTDRNFIFFQNLVKRIFPFAVYDEVSDLVFNGVALCYQNSDAS